MKFLTKYKDIVSLLLLGLALRLLLASFGTLFLDQNTFIAWSDRLVNIGFGNFYDAWSDYLPGYLYVLWVLAKIKHLIPIDPIVLYKLPAVLADILTGFFIFKIVKQKKGSKWAIVVSSLYTFNPAIFANSSLWGQVDSLTALFSVMAIYFTSTNWLLSAIFLALGALVKPQAGFVAIVILFIMLKNKWKAWKITTYILVAAGTFVSGFLPFAAGRNILSFILERLAATANQYPYTSINAFNFWGVVGFWRPDNAGVVSLQLIGILLAVWVSVLPVLILIVKKKDEQGFVYRLLAILLLSSFVFLTRMHERHLMPALAPLAVSVAFIPSLIIPYIGLSVIYLANLRFAFVWITQNFDSIFPAEILTLFSFLSVVFLSLVIFPLPKKIFGFFDKIIKDKSFKEVDLQLPKLNLSKKNSKLILIAILVFAFTTRLLFLNSPQKEYFDEVYHAFTARTMLHGDVKAWEWWNTPPEGFAYEWTHPPLAKLAMWGSMAVFGENSFAWRLPEAIAGTLAIFVVYLLGKKIFNDEVAALLSAFVLSLDGLMLVMSRIGMNDSYFILFALLTIYLFLADKNLLSAVLLGLAAASKWTTLWVLPILFVAHFVFKKKLKLSYVGYIVLPVIIYLAAYIPFFTSGHTFDQFFNVDTFVRCTFKDVSAGCSGAFGVQQQMWWYHTNLKATHAYSSNPLSWPLLIRPIWLYTSGKVGDTVANIYAMGNPIVFWVGLVSVFVTGYWAIVTKSKKLGFVVFCYLVLFLPWALSPRIMFLYHYLPAIPFLSMATGFVLRKYPKNIWAYSVVCLIVFIYFFPHWAGIQIPVWLDNSYYWIDKWR
ncbi:MAG: glycosyltransferase family 39 protein [Patescibacteria group bacterium]